ncbi:hypothetical protein QS257_14220 [Terrilactibacillus sp. S3-3]|nr:hypothetical protein QS257_14220 [Terrilactibacillus sp. S3-3]
MDQFAIKQINHIFAYAMNEQHRHLSEYYKTGDQFLRDIFAGKEVDEQTEAKWFPFMKEAADIYCAVLKFPNSEFLLKTGQRKESAGQPADLSRAEGIPGESDRFGEPGPLLFDVI